VYFLNRENDKVLTLCEERVLAKRVAQNPAVLCYLACAILAIEVVLGENATGLGCSGNS
jgi:hypothetical protein